MNRGSGRLWVANERSGRAPLRHVPRRVPNATTACPLARWSPGEKTNNRWQLLVGILARVYCCTQLLEVIQRLGPGGCFANLLHGGQEETDEDANDGNHNQKLDQREAPPTLPETEPRHDGLL